MSDYYFCNIRRPCRPRAQDLFADSRENTPEILILSRSVRIYCRQVVDQTALEHSRKTSLESTLLQPFAREKTDKRNLV